MRRETLSVALCVAVFCPACGSSARPARVAATEHHASAPAKADPPDLRRLHQLLLGLDEEPRPSAAVAQALSVLSRSTADLDVSAPRRSTAIEDITQQLAATDARTAGSAGFAKRGLRIVATQLARFTPPAARRGAFARAVSDAGDAAERLDGKATLADQWKLVVGGLRAAGDAVRLATDRAAWFADPAMEPATPLRFEPAVTQLRTALLDFADTRWADASDPASRALSALADLLDASAECGASIPAGATTELRFQAGRIRRAENTIGQGGWIKRALSAAMDGIDAAANANADPGGWRGAARDAIAKINDQANLAFSRAPIQGAFRATVDAAILALQPLCAKTPSAPASSLTTDPSPKHQRGIKNTSAAK